MQPRARWPSEKIEQWGAEPSADKAVRRAAEAQWRMLKTMRLLSEQNRHLAGHNPLRLGTVGRRSDGGAKRGGSEEIRLLSRLIGIIITILIIVWIVSNPATAGNDVHGWIAGIFVFFHHVS